MRDRMKFVIALLGLFLAALPASAQDWPTRPVKIVVPFGAGSTPDVVARLIADHLQKKLGQPFVIDNKPGASGNIGTDAVAKAAPDGATIGVSIGGPLAINTLLFSKLPYDPKTDIAPITQLVTQPSALAVNSSVMANSAGELVELLRREPGKYNFGAIGSGSIKILAVSTAKRSPYLPDIPTLKEAGIDVDADAWMGMIAPAHTPEAIVAKIQRAVVEALGTAGVRDKLAAQLMEPVGNSPAEFRARIDGEIVRWGPVIKAAN